jgi:hypothetical protein
MSLNVNQQNQKTDFGRIPDGNFPARPVQIIDLGEQHVHNWFPKLGKALPLYYEVDADGNTLKNEEGFAKTTTEPNDHPKYQPMVYVQFEFPTQRIDINGESKPRWQSKEYNVTSSGAIAKLVEALSPGSQNISDILGKPCLVQIGSTSGGKAKVTTVTPPIDGMTVGELENPTKVFDMDAPDLEVYNSLPNFIKNKIKAAKNYNGFAEEAASQAAGFDTEEPPFANGLPDID